MPAAIPYIIYAIGTAYAVNTVIIAVAVLAASAAVANYQKRKSQRAARDRYNASLEDRLVMTATSNGPRNRVYGRQRNVDGVIFKGTHGTNSEFYTLVVAMAGHEIDGFEKIYFNDQAVTLLADGNPAPGGGGSVGYYINTAPYADLNLETQQQPTTADGSGNGGVTVVGSAPTAGSAFAYDEATENRLPAIISGSNITFSGATPSGSVVVYYQNIPPKFKARIWLYNGAPGQDVSLLLASRFPSLITSTDKFSGMALAVVELEYSQDAYPNGVPAVSAVMRGAKVLDTRDGVTRWTENPALIARDWCLYPFGGAMTTADINEAAFIAAANACDVSTTFNTTTGNEVRPLYQCGIVCDTSLNADDHFGEIVESMAGRWGFAGGQMKVVAGVYRAPVAAVDETWLSGNGSITIVKDQQKADLVNCFKPVIANADGYIDGATGPATPTAYTSTPMPLVRSQTFINADGQELIRENVMLGVTRSVHAQHICGVIMRDMRDAMVVQIGCNMRAWQLELFDVVTLTLPVFGINAKQFEVMGWKYTLDGGVELSLKETGASIFAVSSGLGVLDAEQNTALPLPWVVEQVSGVTVVSSAAYLQDGWPMTRVEVSWNPIVSDSVRQSGTVEIQYTIAGDALPDGDWPSVIERGNSESTVISGLLSETVYVFRVRAVNTLGVRGRWSLQTGHLVAAPPKVDTPIIEPEAATIPLSQTLTPGSTGTTGTVIGTMSWTNTKAVSVIVQAEWSGRFTNTGVVSGSTASLAFGLATSGGATAGGTLPAVTTGNSYFSAIVVPPGETVTSTITAILGGPNPGVDWTAVIMRLTAIIR